MSDLSSSIEEDGYRPRQIRKVLKQSRSASDRTLKRPGHMQDCSKGDVERRFRRVMKACDRCRLKKTKVRIFLHSLILIQSEVPDSPKV